MAGFRANSDTAEATDMRAQNRQYTESGSPNQDDTLCAEPKERPNQVFFGF